MKILTPALRMGLLTMLLFAASFGSRLLAQGNNSVTLCHNGNTIAVSPNAVNAHLGHGDALGACAADCINPNLIDPNRFCITLYDPVCGCDGRTYSNGCVATFGYGVTSYTQGACGGVLGASAAQPTENEASVEAVELKAEGDAGFQWED